MSKMTPERIKQINDAVDYLESERVPSNIAARMLGKALGVTLEETLELIEIQAAKNGISNS